MKIAKLDWNQVDLIIENALEEDIGPRDLTTELLFPEDSRCNAIIQAKEEGIIAGLPIAKRVFRKLKNDIAVHKEIFFHKSAFGFDSSGYILLNNSRLF